MNARRQVPGSHHVDPMHQVSGRFARDPAVLTLASLATSILHSHCVSALPSDPFLFFVSCLQLREWPLLEFCQRDRLHPLYASVISDRLLKMLPPLLLVPRASSCLRPFWFGLLGGSTCVLHGLIAIWCCVCHPGAMGKYSGSSGLTTCTPCLVSVSCRFVTESCRLLFCDSASCDRARAMRCIAALSPPDCLSPCVSLLRLLRSSETTLTRRGSPPVRILCLFLSH